MKTFSSRLIGLRKAKNLTQEELGEAIGFTGRAIRNYEGQDRLPKMEVAIALADFFDTSLDYLVGRSDTPERR